MFSDFLFLQVFSLDAASFSLVFLIMPLKSGLLSGSALLFRIFSSASGILSFL
jgi:hypothetical protein